MKNLEKNPEKRKKWNRISILFLTAIFIVSLILLGSRVIKVQKKCDNLSDSLKEVTTLVKDTIFPVLASQQSYVQQFKDSFVSNTYLDERLSGQKVELTSYVNSRCKKVDKRIETFQSSQSNYVSSFTDMFNLELKNVKSKQDSFAKVTAKNDPLLITTKENPVNNTISLPVDTNKVVPVITNDKPNPQNNGGKGGQKKFRFERIFKSSGSVSKPGW